MTTNNKTNSLTQVQLDQKVQSGIDKHFASLTALTIANTLYTPVQLKQVFQDDIDAQKQVDEARSQLKQKLADLKAKRTKARTAQRALKRYILGMYGEEAPSIVEDFGFTLPKSTANKPVKVKAQAAEQAKATRELRHTMGSKQKKDVKSPPVELQVVPASPAPATTPTPSTAPTGNTPPPAGAPAAPSKPTA